MRSISSLRASAPSSTCSVLEASSNGFSAFPEVAEYGVRVLRVEEHRARPQLGDERLEVRKGRVREHGAHRHVQQPQEPHALKHDDDHGPDADEIEAEVAHVDTLAHQRPEERAHNQHHPKAGRGERDGHLPRQAGALELQHDGPHPEGDHHAEEGEAVDPAQPVDIALEDRHLQCGQEEEDEGRVVGRVPPAVAVQQELRQHAIAGHAAGEAVDAHVRRQDSSAQDDEGVHAHDELQHLSERVLGRAHARDPVRHVRNRILEPVPGVIRHHSQQAPMRRLDIFERQDTERDQGDDGVEHHDADPHVAKRLDEDAWPLGLDELARALEARDAEHAGAGAEVQGAEGVALHGLVRDTGIGIVGVEVLLEMPASREDHVHNSEDDEHDKDTQVQNEDEHGHFRRVADSPGLVQRKEASSTVVSLVLRCYDSYAPNPRQGASARRLQADAHGNSLKDSAMRTAWPTWKDSLSRRDDGARRGQINMHGAQITSTFPGCLGPSPH
eukprot:scaffold148_cov243-Pinguiococcus_pyrenoidosus.AAC.7